MSSEKEKPEILCDYCTEDPADLFCENCQEHYCNICDPVLHANPKMKHHKRLAIGQATDTKKPATDPVTKKPDAEAEKPATKGSNAKEPKAEAVQEVKQESLDFLNEDPDSKEFAERLERYTNREYMKECRIMVIGLSQHGKSTTLNTIFGEECFPSGKTGQSTTTVVRERQHPKVKNLIFIDTPGLSDTKRNDEEIYKGILKFAKGKDLHCIIVCRRFAHPNTKDYVTLKNLVARVSKVWKKTPIIIVYTRSHDKPDAHIANNLKEDVTKYCQDPYKYEKKVAKFAAFRNMRIIQAKRDGFHACFFFENQAADEDWKLPDESSCLDPLINFITQLSPDLVPAALSSNMKKGFNQKEGFFGHILLMVENIFNIFAPRKFQTKDKSTAKLLPRQFNGMCHACTFLNDSNAADCSLCNAPLVLKYIAKE